MAGPLVCDDWGKHSAQSYGDSPGTVPTPAMPSGSGYSGVERGCESSVAACVEAGLEGDGGDLEVDAVGGAGGFGEAEFFVEGE